MVIEADSMVMVMIDDDMRDAVVRYNKGSYCYITYLDGDCEDSHVSIYDVIEN